jgi:integrase
MSDDDMTDKYRLFRRASRKWYIEDRETGVQQSLRTTDENEATRLFNARNEAQRQPAINVLIARAYLNASDPSLVTRTWQSVMDSIVTLKQGSNGQRWGKAIKDKSFESLRQLPLIETRADHFLKVLTEGKVSSNVYLRRIHNYALAMDWLLKPVIPKALWPKVRFKTKRAVTAEEHKRIIEREKNPERRAFYELCWHLGGSQMDIANLTAEDVNWNDRTISYERKKLENLDERKIRPPIIHFGNGVATVLNSLPVVGPLFPSLLKVQSKDRANEFRQRCHGLEIFGVSLHSYRYSWAERARTAGYPERFAQEALGHNSKAVHRAYAKKAKVRIDSLEEWERKMKEKIVPVKFDASNQLTAGSSIEASEFLQPDNQGTFVGQKEDAIRRR